MDAATMLAKPNVQRAIHDLIVEAMESHGVQRAHAHRAANSFVDRIREGKAITSAIFLVHAVNDDGRIGLAEAARMVDVMRDEEITDLRQVRDRLAQAAHG